MKNLLTLPFHKIFYLYQVTDSQDPFFYFSLCLTEEDFQHLKSSQGLLGKLKGLGHELELKIQF